MASKPHLVFPSTRTKHATRSRQRSQPRLSAVAQFLVPRRLHSQNCRNQKQQRRQLLIIRATTVDNSNQGQGIVNDGYSTPPGFDLSHCIALAGCSFEAYSDPDIDPIFVERSSNATRVVYTDHDFVQDTFQSLLYIHLEGASKLPAKDILGKSDPYVRLNIDQRTVVSRIVPCELNPRWDQEFFIFVEDASSAMLTARVFDADAFKSDDTLGVAYFPLGQLRLDELTDVEIKLQGDGGGGMIFLKLKLLPFDDDIFSSYDDEDIQSVTPVEGINDLIVERFDLNKRTPQLNACPSAWKALAVVAGKRAEELFDPVCFIENAKTDTQVWLFRNIVKKECVIAFRGTEQFKLRDLITDADTKPAVFDVERTQRCSSLPLSTDDVTSDELLVHRGFLEAYDSVRPRLFDLVKKVTAGSSEWTVYTTGHSLGGALATLCAFELASRWVSNPPVVKMYNYGSPRVGNRAFAEAFDQCVTESWRIVSRRDLVTTVPRLSGYRHVDRVVAVDKEGDLHFDGREIEMDHLEGIDIRELLNKAQFEALGKVVLEYELKLMRRIMDGSGLEEHMETNYLTCLQCCIRFKGD